MNAAELLIMAAAEGVQLALDGERLTWNADHQPPAELLVEIKAHRQTIIAALIATNDLSIAATALPDELQHQSTPPQRQRLNGLPPATSTSPT